MKKFDVDILISGAGPVGLMCAYLSQLSGMKAMIVDPSPEPLQVGRADALNARTLQLLEIVDLFKELYPLGKVCNTSSVWANGKFLSRQSSWWEEIEGCFHKHFLMLGQAHVEKLLDSQLQQAGNAVKRLCSVEDVQIDEEGCTTKLSSGELIRSRFVIGADGSRSRVRELFKIPFEITRPQIVWAVIDGIIDTDFNKVPEIIVFQAETSDVAWIPREGEIDRFYIRMDTKDFTLDEAMTKINRAMAPHTLRFKKIEWFSQFSVKESVAEKFSIQDKVFLAGDACHIHSVNGGQGLNTGLADAFNLIWKLSMVTKSHAPKSLLKTYEAERKPVALSVIGASGELVRATKFSERGTHAQDYVQIVRQRAGHITGMGIRYGEQGLNGQRLFDFEFEVAGKRKRVYSVLDYSKYTLLIFGEANENLASSQFIQIIQVPDGEQNFYSNQAILVRPDGYIEAVSSLEQISALLGGELSTNKQKARAYHTAVSNYDVNTVEKLVDLNYIQHNPYVPTGRAAFVSLLPKLKQHGSKIENVRMIQDGFYIAMHHIWKNAIPFGGDEMAAFHVLRFDETGLIAEHWNVMSPLYLPEPATRPLVDGETAIKDLCETASNKAIVAKMFSQKKLHKILGEGNFVLAISEGAIAGKPTAFYDLFRLELGEIAEKWQIAQEIPQTGLANSNTMFNFS